VNSFINHRVDVGLMDLCGHALADCFKDSGTTLILTAQTSGVLPAQVKRRRGGEVDFSVFQARTNSTQLKHALTFLLQPSLPPSLQACARYLERPMIFAREKKPITITEAYQGTSIFTPSLLSSFPPSLLPGLRPLPRTAHDLRAGEEANYHHRSVPSQ